MIIDLVNVKNENLAMSSKDKEGTTSKGRRWRFSRKKMKNNSSSTSGMCYCFVF